MSHDHDPPASSDSEPPDAEEEASLLEIEALLRSCIRSLDGILDMTERFPPPARDPAPSAPPG